MTKLFSRREDSRQSYDAGFCATKIHLHGQSFKTAWYRPLIRTLCPWLQIRTHCCPRESATVRFTPSTSNIRFQARLARATVALLSHLKGIQLRVSPFVWLTSATKPDQRNGSQQSMAVCWGLSLVHGLNIDKIFRMCLAVSQHPCTGNKWPINGWNRRCASHGNEIEDHRRWI